MRLTPTKLAASLARRVGRPVNSALARLGFRIIRASQSAGAPVMGEALRRAASRGIPVATVIDVGASGGAWSDLARTHYPKANFLLIEANRVHEPDLVRFTTRVRNSHHVLAAAGNRVGDLYFDSRDPFGGLASTVHLDGSSLVAATTVDREVDKSGFPGPHLLKLDTHGFELPILEGATKTLGTTSLLVVEVYNFTLAPGALLFYEMCDHLSKLGFRPIDLCDPMCRPVDGAFWQCDLFFARQDRAEFRLNKYQ